MIIANKKEKKKIRIEYYSTRCLTVRCVSENRVCTQFFVRTFIPIFHSKLPPTLALNTRRRPLNSSNKSPYFLRYSSSFNPLQQMKRETVTQEEQLDSKPLFIPCIFPAPFLFVSRGDRGPETDVRAVKNDRRRASGLRCNRNHPPLLFSPVNEMCFRCRSRTPLSKTSRKTRRDHNPEVARSVEYSAGHEDHATEILFFFFFFFYGCRRWLRVTSL